MGRRMPCSMSSSVSGWPCHRDEFHRPGAEGEEAVADVLDGLHGIVFGDHGHRHRVVEVDPVGHLLGFRQCAWIDRGECADIGCESFAVFGARLQGAVVEAVDAGGMFRQTGVQDLLPGAVIDRRATCIVADVPHGNELGLGSCPGDPGRENLRRRERGRQEVTRRSGSCPVPSFRVLRVLVVERDAASATWRSFRECRFLRRPRRAGCR